MRDGRRYPARVDQWSSGYVDAAPFECHGRFLCCYGAGVVVRIESLYVWPWLRTRCRARGLHDSQMMQRGGSAGNA